MEFRYANLDDCHDATGTVVVIDVIRAFTTAACAFRVGASSLTLVSGVGEALALRDERPGCLVMGEEGGLPPPGFDLGNSPAEVLERDLRGRDLVQRTGAGTQGVVRSVRAAILFAASFVVAAATVRAVRAIGPPRVTFVVTGHGRGDEDLACGRYLEALLRGEAPDPGPYLDRVRSSAEARAMTPDRYPTIEADLEICTRLDAFPFAMRVHKEAGRSVLRVV